MKMGAKVQPRIHGMSQTKHGFPVRNSIMTKRDEIEVFFIAKLTHSSLAYGYELVNGFVVFIACQCVTHYLLPIYMYIYKYINSKSAY